MFHTYTDVLTVDEELRHLHIGCLHAIFDILLMLFTHEDVTFVEFDKKRSQDLLHIGTFCISFTHNSHTGRIQYHFAGVFLFVILFWKIVDEKLEINSQINDFLIWFKFELITKLTIDTFWFVFFFYSFSNSACSRSTSYVRYNNMEKCSFSRAHGITHKPKILSVPWRCRSRASAQHMAYHEKTAKRDRQQKT